MTSTEIDGERTGADDPRNIADPAYYCRKCPRLFKFLESWRQIEKGWYNGPVPTFTAREGDDTVVFLIVGLAPGLRGANRTGRPFTGDYAGALLYNTLAQFDLSRGNFDARSDDGLQLVGTAITNAVRCVPPQNKPEGTEINNCREFLEGTIARFKNLKAILNLGVVAHQSTVKALGGKVKVYPFSHGARTMIGDVAVYSSYHCSRYNTNTGRLTEEMFVNVFKDISAYLNK